jgi:hypothetical protein
MTKWLVTLLAGLAMIDVNAPAAAVDDMHMPHVQIAQQRAGSAGPVGPPSSRISKPNPFPSSSGTSIHESNVDRSEEYSTAIQNCQTLPSRQRTACIDDTNKRFGQM